MKNESTVSVIIGIIQMILLIFLILIAIDLIQKDLSTKKETKNIATQSYYPSYSKAEKTAMAQGYTIIRDLGYSPFLCSSDDSMLTSTKLDVMKNGISSEIAVCCGLVKGCTIRY